MQKIWNNGDVCDWGDGPRLTVQGLMKLGSIQKPKGISKERQKCKKTKREDKKWEIIK